MATLLCIPIMVLDVSTALDDAAMARDAGADLVEFRIDQFFTGSTGADQEIEQAAVVSLVGGSPLPCIVTCRPAGAEGGDYDGDEPARIALFERLAIAAGDGDQPPRYLDVELTTMERSANVRQKILLAVDHPEQIRDLRTSLILSTHDFSGRPADLFRRLTRMRAEPAAAVHKIAYMARSVRDNLDLFDLLAEADRPTIALAMGRYGLMSRVLAPKFGGLVTFASLRPASATAPGQPTAAKLLSVYRFRSIRSTTKVYGVIGDPVEHSLSPAVHNAGFEEIGAYGAPGGNGVYVPLPVPAGYEHFKATLLALVHHGRLDFSGCSVTIPHKENLMRVAREQADADAPERWEVDELSTVCGAANTVVVERDASGGVIACRVMNTDAPAAVSCLRDELGDLAGKRVAVIGAGGVARGIIAGLLSAGARVLVVNRSKERAEALVGALESFAARFPGATIEVGDQSMLAQVFCDAYVNCTPVGMKGGPAPEESPINISDLAINLAETASGHQPSRTPVVMDTVYNPLETKLISDATRAGFRTIDGLAMFVRQARMQFRAWTGKEPSAELFEGVARETLFADNSL